MTCRDNESLILAERDGVLTKEQQAALSDHVAACASCRKLRADLATALDAFKNDIANVPVPDADEAWRDLQARLHAPTKTTKKSPLAPVIWFGSSLAAAAAIALAMLVGRTPPPASLPMPPPPESVAVAAVAPAPAPAPASVPNRANADAILAEVARAEYVEAGDVNASTMVYVDKDSGWLVVWATDATDDSNTRG